MQTRRGIRLDSKPGVVVHAFNPSTRIAEFEASLVYKVSFRTARAIQRNPVTLSRKTNKQTNKQTKRSINNQFYLCSILNDSEEKMMLGLLPDWGTCPKQRSVKRNDK